MYTLVLNLDEVDISLKRVMVQNDMRSRLTKHRLDLVQALLCELCSTSVQLAAGLPVNVINLISDASALAVPVLELFSVRKGIRLFGAVLHYLPSPSVRALTLVFISNYAKICAVSEGQVEEVSANMKQFLLLDPPSAS
ncbi:unnamed protein product [Echinostoma caproni]|uniref:Katanin_con80 domain-containing protein n=1 Tax=Echinostoma caproni TaxID=27848 RepID=A0A183B759_9TREM|nr:unnamed protein product [Echinostoma caproni]